MSKYIDAGGDTGIALAGPNEWVITEQGKEIARFKTAVDFSGYVMALVEEHRAALAFVQGPHHDLTEKQYMALDAWVAAIEKVEALSVKKS